MDVLEFFSRIEGDLLKFSEEMDRDNRISDEFFDFLRREKLFGFGLPKEFGGMGLDFISSIKLMRLIGGISPALGLSLMVNTQVANILLVKKDVFRDVLGGLASGDAVGGLAITEVEAGSDVGRIRCTLRKVDGKYVLSGSKSFVTNGLYANVFAILARLEEKNDFVLVSVEKGEGVEIEEVYDLAGMRGAGVSKVVFRDVEVGEENLIVVGKDALKITLNTINLGRIYTAAISVGVVDRLLKMAIDWSSKREVFGKKLVDSDHVQIKLAEYAARAEAAWLATLKAGEQIMSGGDPRYYTAVAKFEGSSVAAELARYTLHLLASHGYYRGNIVERLYRDAKALEIMEGTSEIQLFTIFRVLRKRLGEKYIISF